MFSHGVREAKMQIISFNLCDVRRIQYWVPVYICDRWCLIATTVTVGVPFHVSLDSSFLLRFSMSVVTHLETFSGVFFYCKNKTWKCIHINLPLQRSLMCAMWCRQRQFGTSHCLLSSTHQHRESSHHHPFISFSTCLPWFFFFLIHVQQVPSIPKHVPRSFPMSAVELKRVFLNLIDQVVTNLAGSHLLDTHQIAAAESSCWVSSVLLASGA